MRCEGQEGQGGQGRGLRGRDWDGIPGCQPTMMGGLYNKLYVCLHPLSWFQLATFGTMPGSRKIPEDFGPFEGLKSLPSFWLECVCKPTNDLGIFQRLIPALEPQIRRDVACCTVVVVHPFPGQPVVTQPGQFLFSGKLT